MEYQKQSPGRCIGKLSNKIRRKIDAFSSKDTFSGAQGRLLHFILAHPDELFQKDIEEEFGMRPSTASELLKKMENGGLIRREADTRDARLKRITATEKALAYEGQVIGDLMGLDHQMMRGIPPRDLEVFFSVVEQMTQNLS